MKFGKLNSPETFDREKFIKYFISLGLDLRLSNKENEKINLCGNQETSCQKKGCLFKSINWFLHSVEYEIVFKCVVLTSKRYSVNLYLVVCKKGKGTR